VVPQRPQRAHTQTRLGESRPAGLAAAARGRERVCGRGRGVEDGSEHVGEGQLRLVARVVFGLPPRAASLS
jgi:hypothetical protein